MFFAQYKVGQELGCGRFGKVVHATSVSDDEHLAVKFVPRIDVSQSINKEVFALQTIPTHPNIIKLKRIVRDVCFDNKMQTALVLQLGANGEMFHHVEKYGYFGEELARTYFRQLLLALSAAHGANVYHRDVKLDNIVLGCNFELLLCDWGLSTYCAESKTYTTPNLGTESYLAPELFERRLYSPSKADLWAATCVLFNLYTGGPPFAVASNRDWHFRAITTNKIKFWDSHKRRAPWATDSFKLLIESVFSVPEADRPSVNEMLDSPWMAGPTLTDGELVYVMEMRKNGHA